MAEHVSIDTVIICVYVLMVILEKTVRQVGKTVESGLVNGQNDTCACQAPHMER